MTHAIDGPGREISNSPEWQRAFQKEISRGKLSKYATTSPSEGFAEFGRLVYGNKVSAGELHRKFPLAAAVWQKHGLMPGSGKAKAKPLREIFDKPIDDGGFHADTLLGRLAKFGDRVLNAMGLSMGPHSFSSAQFNLPQEASSLILDMAGNVDSRDLAGDGFEKEIHVTALYGLHDDDPAEVRRVVEGFGPVRIRLGEISVFPANESDVKRGGDCYDVVKIDVDSPDLHRLHQRLAKLPHTDTYPEYCPHVTLFYAKPGKGQEYAGEHPLMGQEILFNRLVFSASSGERTEIFLTKRKPRGN